MNEHKLAKLRYREFERNSLVQISHAFQMKHSWTIFPNTLAKIYDLLSHQSLIKS
jgi:hypothetical protein